MTAFETMARAALELQGTQLDESDAQLLAAVALALEPGMLRLDEIDLAGLPLESGLDPSRAPAQSDAGER